MTKSLTETYTSPGIMLITGVSLGIMLSTGLVLAYKAKTKPITVFVLPSQERIQQCLKDRGYPVEVDGVIGADSRRYWDQAIIADTMKLIKERTDAARKN